MNDPRRAHATYWRIFSALALANVVLVWILPAIPGQDIPQHLAYGRILLDHARIDAYQEVYSLPAHAQPYFTLHYLLAAIGKLVGVPTAGRVLFTAYVVAFPLAYHYLAVAVHDCTRADAGSTSPVRAPPWSGLLGACFVWNPITLLGLFQYALTVPMLLFAIAVLFRDARGPVSLRLRACAAAAAIAMPCFHPASIAPLFAIAGLLFLFTRTRSAARAGGLAVAPSIVALVGWSLLGRSGMTGAKPVGDLAKLMRESDDLDFIASAFDIKWTTPLTKISIISWTSLGPHNPSGLVLGAVVLAGCVLFGVRAARREKPSVVAGAPDRELSETATSESAASRSAASAPRRVLPLRAVMAGFAVLAWLCPWGIERPTEMVFIDLRIIALAVILGAVVIPARWFRTRGARLALVAYCGFLTIHFGVKAMRFGNEARAVISLLDRAQPTGMMFTLVFDGASPHLARRFHVTHFLPMYYTSRSGGMNTQFWAQYTDHLPVGYRGRQPLGTPDWKPWTFTAFDLEDADWLLIQKPAPEDDRVLITAAGKALEEGAKRGERVGCASRWCLFRIRQDPNKPRLGPVSASSFEGGAGIGVDVSSKPEESGPVQHTPTPSLSPEDAGALPSPLK